MNRAAVIQLAKNDALHGEVNRSERFNPTYRQAWYEEQQRKKSEALYYYYNNLYSSTVLN